ncbi:MAG TPA: hypothetical protein VMT68_07665 [Caulobacteraceae bacterium]|nr:hypothetical protein [Caulobacteraceae bacterium]
MKADIARDGTRDRFGLAAPFGKLTVNWLKICAVLLIGAVYAARPSDRVAEAYFFWRHDLPVLIAMVLATAALGWPAAQRLLSRRWPALSARLIVLALAAVCLVVGSVGSTLVFDNYTLSLDEFMANFDARIFARGDLMAPIAPTWQPFAPALQPMFDLPVPEGDYWASAYLPVNAGMRALGRIGGVEWLVNPLLSAFSIVATWAVARRLWPDRPDRALIAAALLGTSAQLIVMAMTAYSMPGHLAFNLAWLWLFLRGGRLGHAAAIVVGLFATGMHQLLFHPVFAAPFVLQLWLDRRWTLAAVYTLAYAVIGVFWVEYWQIELRLLGESQEDAGSLGHGWLVERTLDVLNGVRIDNIGAMGESLMRFVTWQNLLAAPLAVIGGVAAFREKGHLRALALGVILTLIAMLILMPTQTHGWGYRYAHGLLASACLIGAVAWSQLTDGLPPGAQAAARGGLVVASLVSLLVLAPIRAWQAWSYVRPYDLADRQIRTAPAKVVIIDHEGPLGFNPGTVVRNDPFLGPGQPKVMQLSYMNEALMRQVCAMGAIEVFGGANAAAAGIDTAASRPEPQVVRLRVLMARLRCGTPMPLLHPRA